MTKKRRSVRPAAFVIQILLNRDDALHVQSKVWNAMIRVLAGFDVAERDRDRLAGVHLHVAGELTHLVRAHVGIELGFDLSLIHISEPTRLGMISYAVFCLKKKKKKEEK